MRVRLRLLVRSVRLEQDGDVGVPLLHRPGELEPGARIVDAVPPEIDVGDDPEDILFVLLEIRPGLVVGGAEEDLGACAHPEVLVGEVHPFGDQPPGLVHDLRVDDREVRGVELDVVLDQDDGLDADGGGVVFHVQTVFHRLDDPEQEPGVSLPDEDPVEDRRVVVRDQLGLFPVIVRQEHDGDGESRLADHLGEACGVHVLDVEGHDHQVEPTLLVQEGEGFLAAGGVGQFRRVAQVQSRVFLSDLLVETAILLKNIVVVQAGDEEDIPYPEPHQVLEALGPYPVAGFDQRLGGLLLEGRRGLCVHRAPGWSFMHGYRIKKNGVVFHSVFHSGRHERGATRAPDRASRLPP